MELALETLHLLLLWQIVDTSMNKKFYYIGVNESYERSIVESVA